MDILDVYHAHSDSLTTGTLLYMNKPISEMTDLEFVDHWIDNSTFIHPVLFRELRNRGLYDVTNLLSGDRNERKAITRARMANTGRYVGEPEIEAIAGHIDRVNIIQALYTACQEFNPA